MSATTHLQRSDIEAMERIPRLQLVNSITGYKPANLIGTVSTEGTANLAIFSSVIHLGSNPALLGIVTRPTTVARHTYENIQATGVWTINAIHKGMEEKAHASSANYEAEESEFDILGWKEEYIEGFGAPFLSDSKLKMGLKLVEEHALDNGCILLIGQVEHLFIPEANQDGGRVDLEAMNVMSISGLDKYHLPFDGIEFPYARAEDYREKWQARPDHIVYDEEAGRYNAALLPYATGVSAPVIDPIDLTHWKQSGARRVSHHLESKYEEIKSQYEHMRQVYEWNQAVYSAEFSFEPVIGDTYHLYARPGRRPFLSMIPPEGFKQVHLGSFRLNSERIWEKVG